MSGDQAVTRAEVQRIHELLAARGAYLLLLEARVAVEVGKLGLISLNGWYVYVGSALGPGGLKRVARHMAYQRRSQPPLRWHVDWLLANGRLDSAIVAVTDRRVECDLAADLAVRLPLAVPSFGSSDCACQSHLFGASSRAEAEGAGLESIRGLGLSPVCLSVGDMPTQ